MRVKMMLILTVLLSSGLGFGCEVFFDQSGYCLEANWVAGPIANGRNELEVKLIPTREMPPVEALEAVLWMPGMGHGSAPTRIEGPRFVTNMGSPYYAVNISRIVFMMPGLWEIRFKLKTSQNTESSNWELML